MDRKNIEDSIFQCLEKDIFDSQIKVEKREVEFGADGLNLDSLLYLKLIMLLEKKWNIAFDDSVYDFEFVRTVSDLVSCIEEKIHQKNGEKCLVDILSNKLFEYRDNVIFVDKRDYTYLDIYKMIGSMSTRFEKDSVGKDDRVIIFLPNCIGFVVAFFAFVNRGCETILLDPKLSCEIMDIIKENNVKYIVTSDEYAQNIQKEIENNQGLSFVRLYDIKELMSDDIFTGESTENRMADIKRKVLSTRQFRAEKEISVILYTSGTVGKPKPVLNSTYNILEALNNYCNTVPFSQSDRMLGVIPFFHSYGFGSCFLTSIQLGITNFIEKKFIPNRIVKVIQEKAITVFHGVPYMYTLLNEAISNPEELKSLKFCVSAGGVMSLAISSSFFEKTGIVIHQEYGSTETGVMALNCSDDLELNQRSVGKALRNIKIEIKESENEIGSIYVKSKGISIGYRDKTFETDEWYDTGDIGYVNAEGYIFICGRKKRMISISGVKVNPDEVETVIKQHEKVENAHVFGRDSDEFGQVVEAHIKRKDETLTKEELLQFISERIAVYKIPRYITWVDELEVSSMGKTIFYDEQKMKQCTT